MAGVVVEIREDSTGEVRRHACAWDEGDEFLWTDGNYGCDCNRALFFRRARGEDTVDVPCSEGRYRIRVTDQDTGEILYSELTTVKTGRGLLP